MNESQDGALSNPVVLLSKLVWLMSDPAQVPMKPAPLLTLLNTRKHTHLSWSHDSCNHRDQL